MNLREQLMAINGRYNIDLIIHYVGCDEELFAQLVNLAHSGELPLAPRAAWAMTSCCDNYPFLILPHLKTIVNNFSKHVHPGITRSVFRSLCMVDIPEKYAGKLYMLCQNYFENKEVPVAIRVFALQIMFNITEQEPDLKPELALLIENIITFDSNAGISNRGKKLLKKLKQFKP